MNFLIPHSFNPRAPYDTDCPPYFYNGGFEPRWPLYRVFADYTSRLSLMLTGGRHVCPVALLYLGQSAHSRQAHPARANQREPAGRALRLRLAAVTKCLKRTSPSAARNSKLRQESYRVLVVPPVEVIPYATLAKAKEFFDKGGVVLAHGFLPSKSATLGKSSSRYRPVARSIWGAPAPGLAVCKTNAARRSLLPPAGPAHPRTAPTSARR